MLQFFYAPQPRLVPALRLAPTPQPSSVGEDLIPTRGVWSGKIWAESSGRDEHVGILWESMEQLWDSQMKHGNYGIIMG